MKIIMLASFFVLHFTNAQDALSLPFETIGDYPETYTSETVMIRMIAGLGYRYHWASKDLRPEDLAYRPSPEAQSMRQTLEHLYGLAETIKNGSLNQVSQRPKDFSEMTYETLRDGTLFFLHEAVTALEKLPPNSIGKHQVQFQRSEKTTAFPYWHMINGPISDALYHTGQVVSFRRTTGNPLHLKVNVFMGKNKP